MSGLAASVPQNHATTCKGMTRGYPLCPIRARVLYSFVQTDARRASRMPTVLMVRGWRVFFYSNEGREPLHVHAQKGEAEWEKSFGGPGSAEH